MHPQKPQASSQRDNRQVETSRQNAGKGRAPRPLGLEGGTRNTVEDTPFTVFKDKVLKQFRIGHEIYVKTSTLMTSYPDFLSMAATSRRWHPQLKVDGGPRALFSPLRHLPKGAVSVRELRLNPGDRLKHNPPHGILDICVLKPSSAEKPQRQTPVL